MGPVCNHRPITTRRMSLECSFRDYNFQITTYLSETHPPMTPPRPTPNRNMASARFVSPCRSHTSSHSDIIVDEISDLSNSQLVHFINVSNTGALLEIASAVMPSGSWRMVHGPFGWEYCFHMLTGTEERLLGRAHQ